MCGICGTIGFVDKKLLTRMTHTMAHRGPDDWGIWVGKECETGSDRAIPVGLGHRRLSIIDLSPAGHQPMSNEDESIWIVYNGEIYNFQDIKRELQSKGHQFKSKTDTEVIIHAYEEWGTECLQRFNGMFAFAIWDNRNQSLFLARDRLGIKPLYYTQFGGNLVFASEIKSILQVPEIKAEVDFDGLFSVLIFLWVPDPKTTFKDIVKLPAGHYAVFKHGRLVIQKYWDIEIEIEANKPTNHYAEKLSEILQRAVKRQMISDVPVGAFLSGGLDSSTIVAFMTGVTDVPVSTYTIAFDHRDQKFEAMPDDSRYARVMAQQFNTHHNEILIRPNITELLPKILWYLDEPIADPAAINTYLISKSAKERGTIVLLNGMGGDEIFGGYRKQLSALIASYYRLLPQTIRNAGIERLIQMLPVANKNRGLKLFRWAKRFAKNASQSPLFCFIGNYAYYNPEEMKQLLNPDLNFDYLNSYPIRKHIEYFEEVKNADYVNQMCYLDSKLFLPSLNLSYSDKATMAASIEARPPLIDDEVVEFTFKIPGKYKIHYFNQKHVFKKAMEEILPKEIIDRPKASFGAPLRSWMRNDLAPMVDELLSEEVVKKRGYFNYSHIRKIIEDNKAGREDYAHRLWMLITLELWHQIFIDH